MKYKRMSNKGITLIALIITIIVLLILAGITIGMLTSNNGILKRATGSKTETEKGEELEIVRISSMEMASKETIEDREKLNHEEMESIVENNSRGLSFELLDDDDGYIVNFTQRKRYYKIYDNGETEEMDIQIDNTPGDITKDKDGKDLDGTTKPFEIWSIEDLVEWSKNYTRYKTSKINLCKNLDFNAKLSYTDSARTDYGDINGDSNTESLIEELKKGKGFTPIDTYSGTFDGQSFKIENIYSYDFQYSGIIGNLSNGNVKNLTIKGTMKRVTNGGRMGGIAGNADNSTIDNCKNYMTLSGQNVGGIAGACNNLTITNCLNISNVNGVNQHGTGGLVGICYGNLTVLNSFNIGNVKMANGVSYCGAGGIFGNSENESTLISIINSYTVGTIESSRKKGAFGSGTTANIINCYCISSSLKDISNDTTIYSTRLTENQMKNVEVIENEKKLVDFLNDYVNEYNETNKNNDNFIELRNWKIGENGYADFN